MATAALADPLTAEATWIGFLRVPASRYTPQSYVRSGIAARRRDAVGSVSRSVFLSPGWS